MDNMPLLIDLIKSKQQYKPMEHERANSVEYNCSSQKPTQALQRKTKVPKANNYKTSVHEVIDLESDAAPASKGSM